MSSSVLIVERDAAFMYAVERTFRSSEFRPISAHTAEEAVEQLAKGAISAMILHPTVEGVDAILAALRAMAATVRPRVIAVSGGGREVIEHLDRELVDVFLSKPVDVNDLLAIVRQLG